MSVILILLLPLALYGQQFPFPETYSVNPFNLSPVFAGIRNSNILFMDYRTDWSGIEGAPTTYELSYSSRFKDKVGLGARFIYDRTDIFKHTLVLGTYTYEVKLGKENTINFGLSAGFYRNSIYLGKYYNDPNYVIDLVLISGQEKSKIVFASDISVLYRYKKTEAGMLFSNVMFGTIRYNSSDMKYKPFKNYLLHASYLIEMDDKWTAKPMIILRGGQHIPMLLEVSQAVVWNNRFWGTALFRSGGILGVGIGGEIYNGIILNYSYNIITNVALYTYGTHQLTMGIKIFNHMQREKNKE
jgi:type IX secretion system PorP/SprF family membrane protein